MNRESTLEVLNRPPWRGMEYKNPELELEFEVQHGIRRLTISCSRRLRRG